MIQFNLLPDVKLDYNKAERSRRLVTSISVIVALVSIAIFVLTLGVNRFQAKHSDDLSNDIARESSQLTGKTELNKVLTVQNQLKSITTLHDTKPAMSRLAVYLDQLTPSAISISNVNLDNTTKILSITGEADAISTANKFIDTLKFTTYSIKDGEKDKKAFSNVVLNGFTYPGSEKKSTYSLSFVYDPLIFDITKEVKLTVPDLITTRSQIEKPSDLFSGTAESSAVTTPKTSTTGQSK